MYWSSYSEAPSATVVSAAGLPCASFSLCPCRQAPGAVAASACTLATSIRRFCVHAVPRTCVCCIRSCPVAGDPGRARARGETLRADVQRLGGKEPCRLRVCGAPSRAICMPRPRHPHIASPRLPSTPSSALATTSSPPLYPRRRRRRRRRLRVASPRSAHHLWLQRHTFIHHLWLQKPHRPAGVRRPPPTT